MKDLEKIAVFVDYDNQKIDLHALIKYLKGRGKILVRRAYGDWEQMGKYRKNILREGFDLIDCPKVDSRHNNSADIRIIVDALKMAYDSANIDTFVIVSGDMDFVPLINELRIKNKYTILVAKAESLSYLLKSCADEFISVKRLEDSIEYDSIEDDFIDLVKDVFSSNILRGTKNMEDTKSLLKKQIIKHIPGFDERDYGFNDFDEFFTYISDKVEERGYNINMRKPSIPIRNINNIFYEQRYSGKKCLSTSDLEKKIGRI